MYTFLHNPLFCFLTVRIVRHHHLWHQHMFIIHTYAFPHEDFSFASTFLFFNDRNPQRFSFSLHCDSCIWCTCQSGSFHFSHDRHPQGSVPYNGLCPCSRFCFTFYFTFLRFALLPIASPFPTRLWELQMLHNLMDPKINITPPLSWATVWASQHTLGWDFFIFISFFHKNPLFMKCTFATSASAPFSW
jgi:hypothetical protein